MSLTIFIVIIAWSILGIIFLISLSNTFILKITAANSTLYYNMVTFLSGPIIWAAFILLKIRRKVLVIKNKQ